ncbi:MAG: response regulator [Candidatus Omnitrophica bacterium]|nr:response regulator [Candidatus Omnitrophota bacterium]
MAGRILIIDDEADFRNVLKLRLEANGYEIIEAADGEEGLRVAEKETVDLIILDIMMPKKDGYTLLKEFKIHKRTKNIPVIVLTAKPDMKDLFAMEGIKHYFIKPFNCEEFLPKVKELILKK